jgi:hypothetical protein
MDFSNYKFRCHQLGKIISSSGKLTDSNKTYLNDLFVGEIEGVKKTFNSKYLEKGLFVENSGIELLNKVFFKNGLALKNKERKTNEFIQGECDVYKDGIVFDVKNAWDLFTFGKAKESHDYIWQLKGYCMLWGTSLGILFYCLNNTPENLLEREKRSLLYTNLNLISDQSPEYIELCNELDRLHDYSNRLLIDRFKYWAINYTDKDADIIKTSVVNARNYLLNLENERSVLLAKNSLLINSDNPLESIKIEKTQ